MEIRTGILKLPKGRRKSDLERGFADALSVTLHDRILPFDLAAAEATAEYVEQLRRSGYSIETVDAQIAGTVIACRARLATRNTSHFPELAVATLNPWTD